MFSRLGRLVWTVRVLARSGMLAPLRPDKYVRMIAAIRRDGVTPLAGISLSAARNPGGTALIDERGSLTWLALAQRSDALAVGLSRLGIGVPRTVGILCRNHRGLVEALGASTRLGADALLLNTGFGAAQLTDVLSRERAEILIFDDEFADLVEHARARIDDLVLVTGWTDNARTPRTVDRLIDLNIGARPHKPRRTGRVTLLTSGTTGSPKGARRSGSGGAGALAAMFERIPWRAEEPTVVAAPLFHAWGFGQLAISATLGCTVVLRRRFDPEATLAMVDDYRARGLALVPVMLERIMSLPTETLDRYTLRTLRFVTASGSRMRSDAVTAFMNRYGDIVYNNYNATEAGLIATATPADLRLAPDTAGRPLTGTDVRILDDEYRPVARGKVGKIAVASKSQFEGYTSGESRAFHGEYMISGDIGRFDDAGRLYVVGRDDEMIVSGGENIYPLEVEEALHAHPAVQEAAVVGVSDSRFGQRLAAYVVLAPGAEATADALAVHVKTELAGYKVPREFAFLDELPRNASGKIVKRQLGDRCR
ncbi:AMP-binding protein [Antrihabitans sp. YC2-6]|uniref:AMP-binding protein n=1 Tax=Antrihabitans sp. YC2-6 TaxID=2799498 RepID=UPI0018F3CE4C|nr:AMP-binding protein [Antrihabitans sp. YC2-6]MBJ8345778.1 bile acid CoA ligase [Antrihabitans sp. YC2-6]